jgi:hypothetical protein
LSGQSFQFVAVKNPSNHALEFDSGQFDQQLSNDESVDSCGIESPFAIDTPENKGLIGISKFTACIIVGGTR